MPHRVLPDDAELRDGLDEEVRKECIVAVARKRRQ